MEHPSPEFIPSNHGDSYANVTIRIPRRVLADVYAGKRVEGVLVPGRSGPTADWATEETKQSGSQTNRAKYQLAPAKEPTREFPKIDTADKLPHTPVNQANPKKSDKDFAESGATILACLFTAIALLGTIAFGMFYNLREASALPRDFIYSGILIIIILLFVASLIPVKSEKDSSSSASLESDKNKKTIYSSRSFKKWFIANIVWIFIGMGALLVSYPLKYPPLDKVANSGHIFGLIITFFNSLSNDVHIHILFLGVLIWGGVALFLGVLRFYGTFTYTRVFHWCIIAAITVIMLFFGLGAVIATTNENKDKNLPKSSISETMGLSERISTTDFSIFKGNFMFMFACNIQKAPANTGNG